MPESPWFDFPISRQWSAQWIWRADAPADQSNTYVYFRRIFRCDAAPKIASAFVSAETTYKLWINGQYIERGVPHSQPFLQYYNEHDITAALKPGDNCVAVLVSFVGNTVDVIPCLLLEITDDAGRTLCATNAEWRAKPAAAWQKKTQFVGSHWVSPYQEFFDANKAPEGWQQADFNDAQWDNAVVLGTRTSIWPAPVTPPPRLIPRDIPFLVTTPARAKSVWRVDESLDLEARSAPHNLGSVLSMVGKPTRYTIAKGVENLCTGQGEAVFGSSTEHLRNIEFDGMYAPSVVLDFGKIINAWVRLDLDAPAGAWIDIGYAERLIDDQFNISLECEFADRYITKAGPQTHETFAWKAFRYLKLRFRRCLEPVRVRGLTALTTNYPYEERGGFTTSDSMLAKCFEISRETLRLCSNEFLMDTPWREQAQWLGDVALVTVPAVHSNFGDTRLTGKFIRQAAANQHETGLIANKSNYLNHAWQRAIPDYSLLWIESIWEHYLYTGEERWVHNFYPHAMRVFEAHQPYLNVQGYVKDMPYWTFIDWANVDRRGVCSAYNGIFYGALVALRQMAQLKGDSHTLELLERLMRSMRENFAETFYDEQRGCVVDAVIGGQLSERQSEHGNMAAVCWGLCDDAMADRLIDRLYVKKDVKVTEAQPYFATVVLRGLARRGRMDIALQYIRDRWGRRMVNRGATSTYEEWTHNGSWRDGKFEGLMRTQSHAWSAAPADFLIRHLMGLTITQPGCRQLQLRPAVTPFDYHTRFALPDGTSVAVECKGNVLSLDHPPHLRVEMQPGPRVNGT